MSDLGTDHRVRRPSVFIIWLALSLYLLSICRGDVRDFITQDIFDKIVYGTVVPLALPVEDIATEGFFNGIISLAGAFCAGKEFYKYSGFITAANSFPGFGTSGTFINNTREIAAFFAHVAHQTNSLCSIENGTYARSLIDCNYSNTTYRCVAGKHYFGRGPLQLAGNYNYGAAGDYLGLDLLNNPDLVAQNDTISWKTALWFWNVNTGCHIAMTSGGGFKETISAVEEGRVCRDTTWSSTRQIEDLDNIYSSFCKELKVEPEYLEYGWC